jgi:hypothetical protein
MGDIKIQISNTLDSTAGDESIGYGNMVFNYEFGDNEPVWPTTSPGNYDLDHENPTEFWQNNCGATEKQCAGRPYYGGFNQCG